MYVYKYAYFMFIRFKFLRIFLKKIKLELLQNILRYFNPSLKYPNKRKKGSESAFFKRIKTLLKGNIRHGIF